MAVEPITPEEVINQRLNSIPDEVITIFNEMIVENWNNNGKYARLDQDKVVARIATRMNVHRQHIYDNGWLDVEPIFRKVGWSVKYDKPAYCEDYDAYFEFRR